MPHGLELGILSLMALKTLNLHLQPFISSPSHRPGPLADLRGPLPAPVAIPPLLYMIYKAVIR
jgi:hypothetical protein